jgi:4-aminobutyrate aminotransferase-like enzyme
LRLVKEILALNAFDLRAGAGLSGPLARQVERRDRAFGAASVLFYERPLEFVRAEGCWLYDRDGVAYLDAYNNVPSVGHCHPRVVAAATRQLAALNIHNRYLHEGTLAFAEALLATLPAPLTNVTFTCTGSESNDLALRLAANFTGARGMIVTAAAYHGNTALATEVSPSSYRRGGPPPHVRVIPAPLSPDGSRPAEEVARRFAADVAVAIAALQGDGHGFAALLFDSIFSSDGVFAEPSGFLSPAVELAQRAGGLVIADEVQPGFGRTGAALWGFERHGIRPDIVTMGKPMGNGYPLAGLVTRPAILDAFCEHVGYFNTFAGSAVAAAVGHAVLDVIAEEALIANAAHVGAHLKRGLEALAARHPAIAEVRGVGLYLGVELRVAATEDGAQFTSGVINALRERQVLIGAAGARGNVLKLRPPLCLSIAEADRLLTSLDAVLASLPADA